MKCDICGDDGAVKEFSTDMGMHAKDKRVTFTVSTSEGGTALCNICATIYLKKLAKEMENEYY